MKDFFKSVDFMFIVFCFVGISFLFGMMLSLEYERCSYKRIVEYVNLPYVLGCELFEKRF